MALKSPSSRCPDCRALRAEVETLKRLLSEMRQSFDVVPHQWSQIQTQLNETQAQLTPTQTQLAAARKTSSNSSKPPSSDIVKPKKSPSSGRRKKRKIGGQPGHTKHERTFSLADADEQHTYDLSACPRCSGHALDLLPGAEKIAYQYELVDQPIVLHAHQRPAYGCGDCQQLHYAPLPATVRKGGWVGPQLSALIGYLKGGCHTSYTTIAHLLLDGMGCSLREGMWVKVVQKVSQALARP